MNLPVGRHLFKFIVDGEWKTSRDYQEIENNFKAKENLIEVFPASIEQLFNQHSHI